MMIKDEFLTIRKLIDAGVDLSCSSCGKKGAAIERDIWTTKFYLRCSHCENIIVRDIQLTLEQKCGW